MAEPLTLPAVVLVTGTSTGVGKTVVTAALAGRVLARGARVAVYKPAQTGVGPDEPGDTHEVCRLLASPRESPFDFPFDFPLDSVPDSMPDSMPDSLPDSLARLTVAEGVRLADPLAPSAAARRAGHPLPTVAEHAETVLALAREHDVVLVEGAGGLLVELDSAGGTLADLGICLLGKGVEPATVIVCAAGLGTLNHTALTAQALASRGLPVIGLVVGAWPADPQAVDLAMRENLIDLPRVAAAPLLGCLPDGVGAWGAAEFARGIPEWLSGVE